MAIEYEEDSAKGAISISGPEAFYRFDKAHGGRLARWEWSTTPPPEALNPATRYNPPRTLSLVAPGGALLDHFLPLGTRLDDYAALAHRELADFDSSPYSGEVIEMGGEIRLGLVRDGTLTAGKRSAGVRLMKSVGLRPGSRDLAVLYRLINLSDRPIQALFGVELNLYAPGAAEDEPAQSESFLLVDGERPQGGSGLHSQGLSAGVTTAALGNPVGEMALQLGWDRECDLWRMAPTGNTPGATRLLALWRLALPPHDDWAMGLWLAPS